MQHVEKQILILRMLVKKICLVIFNFLSNRNAFKIFAYEPEH